MNGKLIKSSKLKVGYFAQHQADELTFSETPYQHLARLMPLQQKLRCVRILAGLGFPANVPT